MRLRGLGIGAALGLAALALFGACAMDRVLNRTTGAARPVSEEARRVHAGLVVVDLHADPLIWNRDLLARGGRGHVDLPRLQEGGVALQVFGVATKTPWGLNFEHNDGDSDMMTSLVVLQRRPRRTWGSLYERALDQAGRLQAAADASGREAAPDPQPGRSRALPRRPRARSEPRGRAARDRGSPRPRGPPRERRRPLRGGLPDDGSRPLLRQRGGGLGPRRREGRADAARDPGGRAHGGAGHRPRSGARVAARGGRRAGARHEAAGGLAHRRAGDLPRPAQPQRRPAPAHRRDGRRDRHRLLRGRGVRRRRRCDRRGAEARRGGGRPQGGRLGSDWDGAIVAPFDAAGLPQLSEALLAAGVSGDELRGIAGGNALRVLRETLPD